MFKLLIYNGLKRIRSFFGWLKLKPGFESTHQNYYLPKIAGFTETSVHSSMYENTLTLLKTFCVSAYDMLTLFFIENQYRLGDVVRETTILGACSACLAPKKGSNNYRTLKSILVMCLIGSHCK